MNIDYLQTYLHVVRLGSFSEAARKLSISQPAVSFQIQKLEHELGIRLIDRSQKTVTITDAGRRLLQFAEAVEHETKALRQDLDQMRQEVTGNIVITASTIPGEFLLPAIIGAFKALHPAIGARVDISDSLTVISNIESGAYDLGFCGVAPKAEGLNSFKIGEDEIVLIVPPEHPFAAMESVSIIDLKGENLILREETSGTQQNLKSILQKIGSGENTFNIVLSTTQAVIAAVEAGLGIAFVSNLAIKNSIQLSRVKEVRVDGMRLRRAFLCVFREERIVSRLLTEFLSFARTWGPSH